MVVKAWTFRPPLTLGCRPGESSECYSGMTCSTRFSACSWCVLYWTSAGLCRLALSLSIGGSPLGPRLTIMTLWQELKQGRMIKIIIAISSAISSAIYILFSFYYSYGCGIRFINNRSYWQSDAQRPGSTITANWKQLRGGQNATFELF